MWYKIKRISYDWDFDLYEQGGIPLLDAKIDDENLKLKVSTLLYNTRFFVPEKFHPYQQQIIFDPQVIKICNVVFDEIKLAIEQDKSKKVPMAYLASRLFEAFSHYWQTEILPKKLHILSIGFWKEVLAITRNWQVDNNNFQIHKGTPFYFLAESFFILGDKDNGFVYLFNGLEDNKNLPELGYPRTSPSFLTATMSKSERPQMYKLITIFLREELHEYVKKFQTEFEPSFDIDYFDKNFIENLDEKVITIVYFFVYNFYNLHDLKKHTQSEFLKNEFSKIKALDLFFNLSLISDQILKLASTRQNYSNRTMGDSIKWWATKIMKMEESSYLKLKGSLNLEGKPLEVIENLFSKISKPPSDISKEFFVMFLSYHIRNHAGHNIDQQDVLISKHEEIIQQLFNAIFISIIALSKTTNNFL